MSLSDLIEARKNFNQELKQQKQKHSSENEGNKKLRKKVTFLIGKRRNSKKEGLKGKQEYIDVGKAKRKAKVASKRGLLSSSSFSESSQIIKAYPQHAGSESKKMGRGKKISKLSHAGNNSKKKVENDKMTKRQKLKGQLVKKSIKPKVDSSSKKKKQAKTMKTTNNTVPKTRRGVATVSKKKNLKNNVRDSVRTKEVKTDNNQGPTKRIIKTAFKAMGAAGYSIPKGLKMTVSLIPKSNQKS